MVEDEIGAVSQGAINLVRSLDLLLSVMSEGELLNLDVVTRKI